MTSLRKSKVLPNAPTPSLRKATVTGGVFMRVGVKTKSGTVLEISNNLAFECKPDASQKVKAIAKNTAQIARLIEERSVNGVEWFPNIVLIGLHDTRKREVVAPTEVDDSEF